MSSTVTQIVPTGKRERETIIYFKLFSMNLNRFVARFSGTYRNELQSFQVCVCVHFLVLADPNPWKWRNLWLHWKTTEKKNSDAFCVHGSESEKRKYATLHKYFLLFLSVVLILCFFVGMQNFHHVTISIALNSLHAELLNFIAVSKCFIITWVWSEANFCYS